MMLFRTKGLLFLSLWLCCLPAMAQVKFHAGTQRPVSPAQNTWHYHTNDYDLKVYRDGKWVNVQAVYDQEQIFLCDQLVVVQTSSLLFIYNAQGDLLSQGWEGSYFPDTLMKDDRHVTYYKLYRPMDRIMVYACNHCKEFQPEIIQKSPAFCVPQYLKGLQPWDWVRTWGMLGTDGKWLIEPKFDESFKFVNGIADVLYYGAARKINEKGEFVD